MSTMRPIFLFFGHSLLSPLEVFPDWKVRWVGWPRLCNLCRRTCQCWHASLLARPCSLSSLDTWPSGACVPLQRVQHMLLRRLEVPGLLWLSSRDTYTLSLQADLDILSFSDAIRFDPRPKTNMDNARRRSCHRRSQSNHAIESGMFPLFARIPADALTSNGVRAESEP
jgi:hypothetical protein